MKMFIVVLVFLLSACNKQEEIIIFDITVKNQDNSVVNEGFVWLTGSKPSISGGATVYEEELPLSENGEIHIEIPLDSKFLEYQISTFHVEYWKARLNHTPQTITGCNHESNPHICELSGGQKIFEIEIIVL